MADKNLNSYDIDSLKKLKGAEPIRKRPASMLGSGGLDGAKHTFWEIIGNALDEISSGYGDRIEVKYYPEDGSISVRDFGRGVPLTWSEKEQDWGWSMVYNTLYAGGKMDDPKTVLIGFDDWKNFKFSDYSYLASIGLNGVGAACSQFTSEYFDVVSYRDGKEYTMHFEKGYPAWEELHISEQSQPDGTFVKWKPDSEVFTDVNITFAWLKTVCEDMSYVSGVDVILSDGKKEIVYPASNIKKRLEERTGSYVAESTFLHHEDILDSDNNVVGVLVCEANVVMSEKGAGVRFFNNQVKVVGGVHEDYSRHAIVEFYKAKGKEAGVKLLDGDILGQYSMIITTLANEKSYRGQTKDSIDNEYIGEAIFYAIDRLLNNSWLKEEAWCTKILERAITAATIREAAKAAEAQIKEANKKINKPTMPSKFVSCEAMLEGMYSEVELFIVEGDSAKGSTLAARDSRFQSILPIRGKSLNTAKASVQRTLNNKEAVEIMNVIGAGMTVEEEGYSLFNMDNLKVGKVIIMTDADEDGKHIQTLQITFIYKYMRPLLDAGLVYLANPPKYHSNGVYYYTEEEFQKAREEGKVGKNFDRYKGLGQMNAQVLWDTTMNPETRKLTQVKIEEGDFEFESAIEVMSGADVSVRKQFVLDALMDGYENYEDSVEILNGILEEMEYEDELEIEEVYY